MPIPTPPQHTSYKQFKNAEDSILDGKLLSYLPLEGWGYRTIDEITEGEPDEAVR
jgi:hypothetical protein